MIADAIGVTKAAVYFHYRAKEDIVLAVFQPALDELDRVVSIAEAQSLRSAHLDAALTGLVELVLQNRRLTAVLHGDPAATALMRSDARLQDLNRRLVLLLAGDRPSTSRQVALTMIGGGLMLAGVDPRMAALDDEVFRREFLRAARGLLRSRHTAQHEQSEKPA